MAKKEGALEVVSPEEKKLATKIHNRHLSSDTFRQSQGLYEAWKEYQKFWDADQWAEPTPENMDYPRPVTNHTAEIIEMKVAGLTYEPPKIYFEPKKGFLKNDFKIKAEPVDKDVEPFNVTPVELLAAAAEDVWEQNDMDQKTEDFSRSSGLLCNGILYSYWDNSIIGYGQGRYIGEIRTVEIDISDFHVGDPTERDIQKQPYVIVTERVPLEQVKNDYRKFNKNVDHLKPSPKRSTSVVYNYETTEQTDTEYIDLIHYWEKEEVKENIDYDGVNVTRRHIAVNYYVVSDDFVLREEKDNIKSGLYPFVNFPWYPRRKSFYGKPETKDLIANQKELNNLQGIALLGAHKTGLPNIMVKSDFVKINDLAIGPGGDIIEDTSPPGSGWAADYMQPPNIASYIPLLKESMAQGMRDVSGVHEAWSGKAPSSRLNASAIMALQEAAGVRIRGIQRRLFSAIRDLGKIWLGYMKQYYTEDRVFKVYSPENKEALAWFKAEDFKKMDFEAKVAMQSASPYSKTVIASTLENMVKIGVIDAEMYLQMLPPEVFPKVLDLLELVEKRNEEQQQMALEQQKQIVAEMVNKTISEAESKGVPVDVQALEKMKSMIQKTAKKEDV